MKPLCDICGDRHEEYQAHRFATNRIATNANATNKRPDALDRRGSGVDAGAVAPGADAATGQRVPSIKTANRRSKEAYNAYQREYMRKRRGG